VAPRVRAIERVPSPRGHAYIGISGWRYPSWRGAFYPPDLPQKRELAYAAERMGSIEINGTFYSLLTPRTYDRCHDETPAGFVLAVKGSRYITHMLRLANCQTPLANFFASGVLRLGEKLGPVLWQLPERFELDVDRLARFFDLLPRDHAAASARARRHDARLRGRASVTARTAAPIRHALEVRHPSFLDDAFVDLARAHDVAVVIADTAGRFPRLDEDTSDFVYVRLHGSEELYASGYTPAELAGWKRSTQRWLRKGRDVYVYFDNDARGHAPFDAMALRALVSGSATQTAARPSGTAIDLEQPRTTWPAWAQQKTAARRTR
jgi:uncharacterized protein YecE (DUF72 family)